MLETLFTEWADQLGSKDRRKVRHNTYLERVDADTIALRLHNTRIIVAKRDGAVHYDSGGWRTVTTKERLNRFGPARVWQTKGVWYVKDHGEFEDGMRVNVPLPTAPDMDWRPSEVIPEDYHA